MLWRKIRSSLSSAMSTVRMGSPVRRAARERAWKHERPVSGRSVTSTKRSEEHTSELQSRLHLVCRLLLEKKKLHLFKECGVKPPQTKAATGRRTTKKLHSKRIISS